MADFLAMSLNPEKIQDGILNKDDSLLFQRRKNQ